MLTEYPKVIHVGGIVVTVASADDEARWRAEPVSEPVLLPAVESEPEAVPMVEDAPEPTHVKKTIGKKK